MQEASEEEQAPTFHVRMQNIVATVSLGMPLSLEQIAQTARNAEYNPRRFAVKMNYIFFVVVRHYFTDFNRL